MNDGVDGLHRRKRIVEGTKDMVDRRAMRNAILDGVQVANRRYEKWSRGGWLSDSGVEGHVVSTIAEKLHGPVSGKGSIAMEMSFGSIRKWSRAKNPQGRPRKNLKARNRADIVVLSEEWRPVCVIEVKRVWHEVNCLKDLGRIRDLILGCGRHKNGLLRSGFLTFLLEGVAGRRRHRRAMPEIGGTGDQAGPSRQVRQ